MFLPHIMSSMLLLLLLQFIFFSLYFHDYLPAFLCCGRHWHTSEPQRSLHCSFLSVNTHSILNQHTFHGTAGSGGLHGPSNRFAIIPLVVLGVIQMK